MRRPVEKITEVVAGGEAVARAVDQRDAHLGIAVGRGERIGERRVHFLRERVLLFGPRDLDAQHPVLGFGLDHAGSL